MASTRKPFTAVDSAADRTSLGPILLGETEHPVHEDHNDDGDAQLRQAPQEGQSGGDPQH